MDDDQITALAREYAEEIYPNLSDKIISLRTQEIKNAERLIRFLTRRYCLVKKADAEEMYRDAKERYFNPDDKVEEAIYGSRMSLLEYLCDEIEKESE